MKISLRQHLIPGLRKGEHRVALRFRPPLPGLSTELRGELTHWFAPQVMEQAESGQLEAIVHTSPGVYQYKFRTADGKWHLDDNNPRTRSHGGLQNSLLVVGGTDEPVMHAPVLPFVFVRPDGRLCVRAGLRKSDGPAQLRLRCFGDQATDHPMQLRAEEDEHWLFETHLPASERSLDYCFVLASGRIVGTGGSGQALRVHLKEVTKSAPNFWSDAVVYTVLLDRFRRGAGQPFLQPPDERARFGGDLAGVRDALPYLQELGVTVLHLTPLAMSYSAHRYDAVNPLQVDPALGGETELRKLIEAAHERGLHVLLDLVLTHVHRDFLPFCDVRQSGPKSAFWDWFYCQRHPFTEGDPSGPGYAHYQKGRWQEPLLRTDHEEVATYLMQQCAHFLQLGADGFRLDAAADVPLGLLRLLRATAHAVKPTALLLGEITTDNVARFTVDALDCATDFSHQQLLQAWLVEKTLCGQQVGAQLQRRAWQQGPAQTALVFTATHDQPRLLSRVSDVRKVRLAHLMTLLSEHIPAIYYGDEIGLHSDQPGRNFEDAWPDRMPMSWDRADWDLQTLALFKEALQLRHQWQALRTGDCDFLPTPQTPQALVLRRHQGEQVLELYAYGDDQGCQLELHPDAPSGCTPLLTLGDVQLDERSQQLRLGAYSAVLVQRHATAPVQQRLSDLTLHNRSHCAQAFRDGQLAPLTLPTHLYLTVTERCNLRCQHCITEAPQRTAEGRAKTMQPWLLDALQEALAAADYFAFSHGGESLVAPIFFELLARIKKARADKPYDVHLLTNGMLLTPQTVDRLLDLGVSSLAVSLDGAEPATNDFIRLGADLGRIVHNLKHAVQLRQLRGANLRIGVSTVVADLNVAELSALGRLVVDLGLDWLKVEELYPVGTFSRQHLLQPRDQRLTAAMQALREVIEPAGVLLIDHLSPKSGCPCQIADDPKLLEFRLADDFGSRAHFRPCRAAWEQACIDPDGTVHPIDYFQPALGSLLHTPLLELWHGPAMQQRRARALMQLAEPMRRACPH